MVIFHSSTFQFKLTEVVCKCAIAIYFSSYLRQLDSKSSIVVHFTSYLRKWDGDNNIVQFHVCAF